MWGHFFVESKTTSSNGQKSITLAVSARQFDYSIAEKNIQFINVAKNCIKVNSSFGLGFEEFHVAQREFHARDNHLMGDDIAAVFPGLLVKRVKEVKHLLIF